MTDLISDYIASGLDANKPTGAPSIHTGEGSVYYATDTGKLYCWTGSVWTALSGGGAITLVSTQTASASAALQFTGLNTATTLYRLIGTQLIPAAAETFNFQLGTGSTTWQSSSYHYSQGIWGSGGFNNTFNSGAGSAIVESVTITNAAPGLSFDLLLDGTRLYGTVYGWDGSNDYMSTLGGRWAGGTSATGVQITAASGNISSGSVSLYSYSR